MFDSDLPGQRASTSSITDQQLRLRGKWLINSAKSVHADLLGLDGIASGDALLESIDCTQIESIDLAGIQLLLSIRKSQGSSRSVPIRADENTREWLSLCEVVEPALLPAAR